MIEMFGSATILGVHRTEFSIRQVDIKRNLLMSFTLQMFGSAKIGGVPL
jgi:hypothetical protein